MEQPIVQEPVPNIRRSPDFDDRYSPRAQRLPAAIGVGNVRQPLVQAAVADAETASESLFAALDVLEQRLAAILSNVPQAAGSTSPKQPMPSVPALVEGLQGLTRRIRAAEFKVREITNRIEV